MLRGILIIKANEMHYFSNLFDKVLCVSDRSTVHRKEYLSVVILTTLADVNRTLTWQIPIARIQCWDTSDDGQWTCPEICRVLYQTNLRNSASHWLLWQDCITIHCPLNVKVARKLSHDFVVLTFFLNFTV